MAWTQDQLTAIEAAIAAGVNEVHYKDKSVKYESASVLMQLRRMIRQELGLESSDEGSARKIRVTGVSYCSGLCRGCKGCK